MWSSTDYFEVTVHQIFADLCPFESFCKLFPALSTAYLATHTSSGRKIGTLCGTMGRINKQQMGPLYRLRQFQDTIQVNSPSIVSSNKSQSFFLPVTRTRDRRSSPEMGGGKGTGSGNSRLLFLAISCTKKERKVTSSNRSFIT